MALIATTALADEVVKPTALRDSYAALALLESMSHLDDALRDEWAGMVHGYRGRVLMNRSQLSAARSEFDLAIKRRLRDCQGSWSEGRSADVVFPDLQFL